MAKIYCIEGKQHSGKTTTIWAIYQCLAELFKDENPHMFGLGKGEGWLHNTMQLIYNNHGYLRDFKAVFILGKIKIGVISAGDDAEDIKKRIDRFINKYKVDLIICAHRSTLIPMKDILKHIPNAPKDSIDLLGKSNANLLCKDGIERILSILLEDINSLCQRHYTPLDCDSIQKILQQYGLPCQMVNNKSKILLNL